MASSSSFQKRTAVAAVLLAALGLTLFSLITASRRTIAFGQGIEFLEQMALLPMMAEDERVNIKKDAAATVAVDDDKVGGEDDEEQRQPTNERQITKVKTSSKTIRPNHNATLPVLADRRQTSIPPAKPPPIPSYSQANMIRLARARIKFLLQLLVFDGTEFHLFSVSDQEKGRVDCSCDTHFIELLIDGLITARPQRFGINKPQKQHQHQQQQQPPPQQRKPFQVLLATVHDNVHYNCIDDPNPTSDGGCDKLKYPPLLTFGSAPKNSSTAPFLHLFPTKHSLDCMYHWRQEQSNPSPRKQPQPAFCRLHGLLYPFDKQHTDDLWDTLLPQIYWRGSNLNFLNDLKAFRTLTSCQQALARPNTLPSAPHNQQLPLAFTNLENVTPEEAAHLLWQHRATLMPRCLAVAMTLRAELAAAAVAAAATGSNNHETTSNGKNRLPWINVKFTESRQRQELTKLGLSVIVGSYTSPTDMAKYKYQIDFGGMGGTTWLGTLTKLAMPGLLFHHETPTKDAFHDELQPWVHYVPIHTNLSNLHDMYVWAETHPEQAKRIAKQGQEYARQYLSDDHLQATFDRLFVQRVGNIADAYQPSPGETVTSILKAYNSSRLFLTQIASSCTTQRCRWLRTPPWMKRSQQQGTAGMTAKLVG